MSSSGNSRLDRLMQLVGAGSSMAVRKAAALTLAELARCNPHDIPVLLARIHALLKSKVCLLLLLLASSLPTHCSPISDVRDSRCCWHCSGLSCSHCSVVAADNNFVFYFDDDVSVFIKSLPIRNTCSWRLLTLYI